MSYLERVTGSGGRVIVGTVSGTSISFGSAVQFGNTGTYASTFDSTIDKMYHYCLERHVRTTQGEAKVGTVSGTSISFGGATAFINRVVKPTKTISLMMQI